MRHLTFHSTFVEHSINFCLLYFSWIMAFSLNCPRWMSYNKEMRRTQVHCGWTFSDINQMMALPQTHRSTWSTYHIQHVSRHERTATFKVLVWWILLQVASLWEQPGWCWAVLSSDSVWRCPMKSPAGFSYFVCRSGWCCKCLMPAACLPHFLFKRCEGINILPWRKQAHVKHFYSSRHFHWASRLRPRRV